MLVRLSTPALAASRRIISTRSAPASELYCRYGSRRSPPARRISWAFHRGLARGRASLTLGEIAQDGLHIALCVLAPATVRAHGVNHPRRFQLAHLRGRDAGAVNESASPQFCGLAHLLFLHRVAI